MISNKELSDFLQSPQVNSAGIIDKLKIGYRPYICPFKELLNDLPEKSAVFDIGCGSGMFLSLVAKYRNPVMLGGIEISQTLISNAQALLKDLTAGIPVFLKAFDGQLLPDEIAEYDHIFLIDVIHHVPKESQVKFIESIYSKMKQGARLVLKDIDAENIILSKFNKLHDLLLSGEIGHELRSSFVKQELERIGFKTSPVVKKRMLVYPHYTITCKK